MIHLGCVYDVNGKIFIYSDDFKNGLFILFSPLCNEYFHDCMDLLEAQYNQEE